MATDGGPGAALGPWEGGDFQSTIDEYGGVSADPDLPDESRFVSGVAKLLLRRQAEANNLGKSDSNDIAIFVLVHAVPASLRNAQRVPMFDNGLTMVTGRVWFTAAAVVSARYLELPDEASDDAHFSYVVDCLGLGSQQTVVFDPRPANPELRWYPEGLSEPDVVEQKPLAGDVTVSEVFEAIERIYQQNLITPISLPPGTGLWINSRLYHPRENAEALVQSYLKIGLTGAFPSCIFRHEQSQPAGRTDLEIFTINPLDGKSSVAYAIIELKVLRSFGSRGAAVSQAYTNSAIEEGVKQAAAYRETKPANWSALCCFDMRKDDLGEDACFFHVRCLATHREVSLKRWFIFASSSAYRDTITGTNVPS